MERTSNAVVIPILGMHRGGTSMFAGLLHHMGVTLGEPLMKANADNPHGYWEHLAFVKANRDLLASTNIHVDGYADLQSLIQAADLCSQFVLDDEIINKFRTALELNFPPDDPASAVWGWKDPRTVLTYRFWYRLLKQIGYQDIRPAVIVRHPAATIRSMLRRVDLGIKDLSDMLQTDPFNLVMDIWKAYNALLMVIVQNDPNCLVTCYEWFTNPDTAESEIQRCAAHLGLDSQITPQMLEFISPRAKSTESLPEITDPQALSVYEQLVQAATNQRDAASTA